MTPRISPLAHRAAPAPSGLAIGLSEVTGRGMIDLRGRPDDAAFLAAAGSIIGLDLPREPRTSVSRDDVTILWLSIDQWLVTLPHGEVASTRDRLDGALAGIFSHHVDMSDARAIIRLEGDGAREVIMKGAAVDLTDPVWGPGRVRRMLFAGISAMFHIVQVEPDTIDLYVFRSYADYAWDWLLATAGERARVRLYGRQRPPAV